MIGNAIYCRDSKGLFYIVQTTKANFLKALNRVVDSDAFLPRTSLIIECFAPKESSFYREVDLDDDVNINGDVLVHHEQYLGFFQTDLLEVDDKYLADVASIQNSNQYDDDVILLVRQK